MIVYCEKCNSKFQVDDAKIPEAGIKGRCSVCAHVFLLKKTAAAATEPAFADENRVAGNSGNAAASAEAAPVRASTPARPVPAWDVPARPASNDVIFEEGEQFGEADELYEVEEVHEADDFRTVFASTTEDDKLTAAHETFAKFVAQQNPPQEVTDDVRAPVTAYRRAAGDENERLQSHPALEQSAGASRHPEVVADGQWPIRPGGSQKPDRAIMASFDQQGLTDDYVVQMVQEICRATKYVEGVEKPDWQTRILGLDMLCKIKGLYASEKKDDQGNRQVQILTGFNM